MCSGNDMPGKSTTCSSGNSGSTRSDSIIVFSSLTEFWRRLQWSLEKVQGHAGEHAHAHVERPLVKVERRAMVRTRQAALGIGRADEEEAAGDFVEEQRHVLRGGRPGNF